MISIAVALRQNAIFVNKIQIVDMYVIADNNGDFNLSFFFFVVNSCRISVTLALLLEVFPGWSRMVGTVSNDLGVFESS